MKHHLAWITLIMMMVSGVEVYAQEPEERLYNFDDMLIDGAFRDPQGMFERARAEAEFEGVLKMSRSFIDKSEENAQESSMRP